MSKPSNISIIDQELRRIKEIAEIKADNNIMAFLNDVHSSLHSKAASNPRGPFKRSLIHYAAMGDCSELLRFLLRNGAAKDDRDQNKRTPLSWAAEYGALTSVKILLEHGAKINSTDDMYSTPLSWLIHNGALPPPKATEAQKKAKEAQIKATEALLRIRGAKEKGHKRRWILRKIRMF
jgi:ankyrin repeat protein